MSQHPKHQTRVSIRRRHQADEQRARSLRMMPVFFRGEMSTETASGFMPFNECLELQKQGLGAFINRGTAFRRFDRSEPLDAKTDYKPSQRRGDSLNISEAKPHEGIGMMSRFVMGDSIARAAVKGWA